MKRLTYKFLLIVLMSMVYTNVLAHDIFVNGIYYNITSTKDKTVEVTYRGTRYADYTNRYSGNVTIPETIVYNDETYKVTGIGLRAFWGCKGLTSVSIANNVNMIKEAAFNGCIGLTEIRIPNGVTSIESDAFYKCTGVTSITIGRGLATVSATAFSKCYNIGSIVIDNNNPYFDSRNNSNAIIDKETNTLLLGCNNTKIPDSVKSIGESAFSNCTGLTTINIPNSVVTIEYGAFYGCNSLTSVKIGDGVTTIGANAFYGCSNISSVSIGKSLTTVGNAAFSGCSGVTSIIIPNSVTNIGSSAFSGCSSLTSIIIPNNVANIGSSAFSGCSGLTSIIIPNSVANIGSSAFSGCSGLTSIIIPNSVTNIGSSAFEGCTSLTKLTLHANLFAFLDKLSIKELIIGDEVTTIPSDACKSKKDLVSVTIGNGVTSIGDYAFCGCSGLTSLSIPNSVITIGEAAFNGCTGLESLTLGNQLTTIGCAAFGECIGLKSLFIPKNVTKIGDARDHATSTTAFYGCSSLESIIVEEGNPSYDSRDNCNALIETSEKSLRIGCKNTIIPDGIKYISASAFSSCSGLTSITIPNSVTYISNGAFYNCKELESVFLYSEEKVNASSSTFVDSNISNAILYVPGSLLDTYKETEPWKDFGNIVALLDDQHLALDDQHLALTQLPAMTYGDESYELPATTTEGLPLIWVIEDNSVAEINNGKVIAKKAGTVTITATQAGNESYNPFTKTFTLTINKAQLIITVNNIEIEYGEDIPELTALYGGLKYNDDATSLTVQPIITTAATKESPIGTYTINVSGAKSDKYNITFVDGYINIEGPNENQIPIPIYDIYKYPIVADINGDGKKEYIEVFRKKPETYSSKQALSAPPKFGSEKNIDIVDGKYYLKIPYEVATGKFLVKGKVPSYTSPIAANNGPKSNYNYYIGGNASQLNSDKNWTSADSIKCYNKLLDYENTFRYAYYEITSQKDLDTYIPIAKNLYNNIYVPGLAVDTVYVGEVSEEKYGVTRKVKQYQIVLNKELPKDRIFNTLTFENGLVVMDDSYYSDNNRPGEFTDIDGVSYYAIPFTKDQAPEFPISRKAAFTENKNYATIHYFPIKSLGDLDYFANINYNYYGKVRYRFEDGIAYELFQYEPEGTIPVGSGKTDYPIVCRWVDVDGNVVSEITGEPLVGHDRSLSSDAEVSLNNDGNIEFLDYINNDNIPDFITRDAIKGSNAKYYLWLSKGSAYEKTEWIYKLPNYAIDINHDGRKDLVRVYMNELFIYVQDKNGIFTQQNIKLITDEKELEAAMFKQEQGNNSGPFTVRGGGAVTSAWGMFVQAKAFDGVFFDEAADDDNGISKAKKSFVGGTTSKSYNHYEVIDINNDGFHDLLNTGDGVSYLSLADGRYYIAALNGKVAVADLDGDGLKDIVLFDKANNRVLLEMCQTDGSFKETKLIDNGSISAIYCRDLNGDGKMDIMLQVPTDNFTIIAFYKNNGNGTFKKYERSLSYKGKYQYLSEPFDLSNNGIPSLLAYRSDNQLRLERIDWDANFNLTEGYVTHESDTVTIKSIYRHTYDEKDYPHDFYDIYPVSDYDGDGLLEIPVENIEFGKWYKRTGSSFITPISIQNTAPTQMSVPNAVIDSHRGLMNVNWKEGKDAQSASGDLRYEVRVGTSANSNDILQDDAGRSSTYLVNVGSWPLGDYYVSIRAIDSNGLHGAWSNATKVTHRIPTANFFIDKHEMSTVDTLVITLNGNFEYTFDAQPDGTVIKQEDGKAYIMFADCGKKTITGKIDGGNSITEEINVEPLHFDGNNGEADGLYFDADMDGKTEAFYRNGLYVFENGKYKALETLFNSDLEKGSKSFVGDYNMDGLPDIYGTFTKGGTKKEGWMVNQGDLDFEIINDEILLNHIEIYNDKIYEYPYKAYECTRMDLDNDGLLDYYTLYNGGTGNSGMLIYHNLGEGNFEEIQFPLSPAYLRRIKSVKWADMNNDGLLDCVASISRQTREQIDVDYNEDKYSNLYLYLYCNKGNMKFEQTDSVFIRTVIESAGGDSHYHEYDLIDITHANNDSYPDIVYWATTQTGYASVGTVKSFLNPQTLIYGNKEMRLEEGTVIHMTPLNCDYDNDGNFEFAYDDSIAFKRGYEYQKYFNNNHYYFGTVLNPYQIILQDINNDGHVEIFADDFSPIYASSVYKNTAPTAPTSVLVNQTDTTIVVSWSGATDQETPLSMLRYNISVKEKGATGDNAYIISPMNGTLDIAKTMDLNNHQYRYATRFPIPFERFKAGKTYEIQVQTIDAWMEHSPFSQVVEFKPAAKALISLPDKGGVNIPIAFSYLNNTGTTPTINADGGVVNGNEITWSTPGMKTVTVTAGTVRNKCQIMILETPNIDMDVPSKVLAGATLQLNVPDAFIDTEGTTALVGSIELTISYEFGDENAIVAMPNKNGTYQLTASYEDEVFGKLTKTYDIEVVGADFEPELSVVSVENGKNKLSWNTQMSLPEVSLFDGIVKIYRESNISDVYECIGEVKLSTGSFVDETSRPNVKSDRYKITLGTIYGTESTPSKIHASIHLMVNKGNGNNINLHWTPYEGVDIAQYIIMSGTSPDNLSEIDVVNGHACSYTHIRNSNTITYYAVAFRTKDSMAGAKARKNAPGMNEDSGESNVISSEEAYNVLMVQSIEIRSTEEELLLDENQPVLHLKAIVTPAIATLPSVEWSIIEGSDYATIDRDGTMHIIPTETGGFVTVQAKAIDGSGVIQTEEIVVSPIIINNIIVGDANGDGEVNVTDIVEIVNYIMERPSDKFVFAAADVNEDSEINVTDIVKVVSIIMSTNNARAFGTVGNNESTIYDRLQLKTNDDHTLSLNLENETGYVASQFDLVLSDGQTLEAITMNNKRSNGHALTYSQTGTNTYRVVIYSLENQSYSDNNGELLNIAVSGRGAVTIENILFITQGQEEKRFAPLSSQTTGISVIEQSEDLFNGDWYDLQGRKIVNPSRGHIPTGIYIVNNKKYVVK